MTETTLLGKPTNILGTLTKELVLRGSSLKFQQGGKFIDILKKLDELENASEIFKTTESLDSVSEDGIYVLREEGKEEKIIICSNGVKVTIENFIDSYVSFLKEQPKITSEQKLTALINSGFYYKTLKDAENAKIESGLIFVLEDNNLYIADKGSLSKFSPADKSYIVTNSTTTNESETTTDDNIENEFTLNSTTDIENVSPEEVSIKNSLFTTQDNVIIDFTNLTVEDADTTPDKFNFRCVLKYPNRFQVNDIIFIETEPIIIKGEIITSETTPTTNKVKFSLSDYAENDVKIDYEETYEETEGEEQTLNYEITIVKGSLESEIDVKSGKLGNWECSSTEVFKESDTKKDNKLIKGKVVNITKGEYTIPKGIYKPTTTEEDSEETTEENSTNTEKVIINFEQENAIEIELPTIYTKLTNKKISGGGSSLLPPNTIIIYYGETIPLGWAKCNGENGTPVISTSLGDNINYIMKL